MIDYFNSWVDYFIENPDKFWNLLFLLFLLWLIWQLLKALKQLRRREEYGSAEAEAILNNEGLTKRQTEVKKEALKALLQEAESGTPENKELAQNSLKALLKQVGMSHVDLKDVSSDADLAEGLAQSLDLETVLGYSKALDVDLPEVKAQRSDVKERSLFPTLDSQVELATNPEDIMNATPEQLYQRDKTYEEFARGELQVVNFYTNKVTEAVLHMVVDVSGSMLELMLNGTSKSVMARAVVYKLLTRARLNSAKFLLRFFDGGIHPLEAANTPAEAEKLAMKVTNNGFSGGGTEILGALKTASRDIRKATKSDPQFTAEIMLITDGEPNTPFTADELRHVLGDVKLHCIIIGNNANTALKEVAVSYQQYT